MKFFAIALVSMLLIAVADSATTASSSQAADTSSVSAGATEATSSTSTSEGSSDNSTEPGTTVNATTDSGATSVFTPLALIVASGLLAFHRVL